jgi:hypothetical protein
MEPRIGAQRVALHAELRAELGFGSTMHRYATCGGACCVAVNMGWLDLVITQNVDRLHHKGGSGQVLELHGIAHRCAPCGFAFGVACRVACGVGGWQ